VTKIPNPKEKGYGRDHREASMISGEAREVVRDNRLDLDALAFYDGDAMRVAPGRYGLELAASGADVRRRATVELTVGGSPGRLRPGVATITASVTGGTVTARGTFVLLVR
jgi:hypothetical protein